MINYEITVDVSGESKETKKKVQDAFSRLGIKLKFGRKNMPFKDIKTYTNSYGQIGLSKYLLFSDECFKPTHKIDELFKLAGMEKEMKSGKNLKPFNLEAALAGEPVVTRDGREVSQVTLFECNGEFPLIAVVNGGVYSFTKQGRHYNCGQPSSFDLFMKPKTHIVNWFEVPAPESEPLKTNVKYYCSDSSEPDWFFWSTWVGDETDTMWLARNLVFLNKEDAIANVKAMLGIDPYKE